MASLLNRLALAATLSIAGILGTLTWYHLTAHKFSRPNNAPLAEAARVRGEVLQRSSAHLMWQSVGTGKLFDQGDSIRTSENGEVRLEFMDGRYVDVGPNTLIVLEKPTGEINLELADGNIFVGSENVAEPTLNFVLKLGAGKIDLTKASAAIARSANDILDVSVWSGKAFAKAANAKVSEIMAGNSTRLSETGAAPQAELLKLISPPSGKKPTTQGELRVQFAGVKANSTVTLLAGRDQKTLRPIVATQKDGETEIVAHLSSGRYWWKLVAKDPTGKITQQSATSFIEIKKVSTVPAVAVAEPAAVVTEPVVAAKVVSRPVASVEPPKLTAEQVPLLIAPKFHSSGGEPLVAASNGRVDLTWTPLEGAQKYSLALMRDGAKIKEKETKTSEGGFSNLLPGDYSVSVVAIDGFGRRGAESSPKTLKVPDISDIQSSKLKKVLIK